MKICIQCAETENFFSNDNPLWQFLSLLVVASLGLITVYIQHYLQKKKDRKKAASDIASESGRLASLIVSRYRSFVENYFSSHYYYGVLAFFNDPGDKQAILSHAEESKATWQSSQKEFQENMANFTKLLNQSSVEFGVNENITALLIKQRNIKLPERPNYSSLKSVKECLDQKKIGDKSFESTIEQQKEILDGINTILINQAIKINNE